MSVKEILEQLRAAIDAENISYGELAELQSLAAYIPADDVQLREWAGIPEDDETEPIAATLANMRAHAGKPGLVAFSLVTGEEYSADYRDYWRMAEDDALLDETDAPMILVTRTEIISNV